MIDVGLTYGGKQYKTMPAGTVDLAGRKPITVPLLATGYTEVLFTAFCRDMYIQIDTTSLIAGDSIDITVEGSLDNVGWDNLSATNVITNITTNRTTLIYFRDACPGYVRILVDATLISGSASSAVAVKAFFAVAS